MRHFFLLLAFTGLALFAQAQTAPPAKPAPAAVPSNGTPADVQASLDRLTQANHDLIDLLKKQQAVLEDIQYDRRLQSRQIASLEERLEETLLQNGQLQNKVANLETSVSTAAPASAPGLPSAQPKPTPAPAAQPAPPPPPSTYLPPEESVGAAGTKSWHRLFTISGTDGKNSDLFEVHGRTWRVLWHNLDMPGKAFANTSALFINAFPKDDTVPQKVCSKLGTGGDATELNGPGNYYLRVEASGGSWELAVEDFR